MTTDMAVPVQAGSLSSITHIAANPPLHPNASIGSHFQPLILYIARVPGSRDVFLTPIKPREKIVTAEDVQSSLYYLHLSSAGDVDPQDDAARSSSVDTDASSLPTIGENKLLRKPVLPSRPPAGPKLAPHHRENIPPRLPQRQRPVTPPRPTEVTRLHGLSDMTNVAASRQLPDFLPALPPRPPPPLSAAASQPLDRSHDSRRTEHEAVAEPATYQSRGFMPSERSERALRKTQDIGSLTLIRRDPLTSDQWNVAKIHDPPVREVSSAALLNPPHAGRRVKKAGAPLFLDITNPAYLAFAAFSCLDGRRSVSSDSFTKDPPPEGTFRRRLYMPGSKYADHSYSQPSRDSRYSISSFNAKGAIPKTMRHGNEMDAAPAGPPLMDRRGRSYSFTSPWDGHCEFSTSASGQSLKCRHFLPDQQYAEQISELRFNLPVSSAGTPSTTREQKRGSYFRGMHNRMRSVDSWGGGPSPDVVGDGIGALGSRHGDGEDSGEEDDRLDLSLGQERAGGGFGGKQAKLGKLIVYPGGVGMLDLLVAANMGLWWRAWEKVG